MALALLSDKQHEIARQDSVVDKDLLQAVDAVDQMVGSGIVIRKIMDDAGIKEVLDGPAELLFMDHFKVFTKDPRNFVGTDRLARADANHFLGRAAALLQFL